MRQFLENKYATIFSIETKEYMQQSISDKTITKQALIEEVVSSQMNVTTFPVS